MLVLLLLLAAAPAERAKDVAARLPIARSALREIHLAAAAISDQALLAAAYQQVYGVKLRDDWLVAAAIWHDAIKAATLPWRDDATCGPEPRIAGTGAHHVLGIAAAMVRRLPEGLVLTIASAHVPVFEDGAKQVCDWLRAASIVADGKPYRTACPSSAPPEA